MEQRSASVRRAFEARIEALMDGVDETVLVNASPAESLSGG
jgi:hypothetical protein